MPQTIRLSLTHPHWNVDETLDAEAACALLAELYRQAQRRLKEYAPATTKPIPSSSGSQEATPLTLPQKIALCAAELEAGGMASFKLKDLRAQLAKHGYVSRNIARDAQRAIAQGLLMKAPQEARAYRSAKKENGTP